MVHDKIYHDLIVPMLWRVKLWNGPPILQAQGLWLRNRKVLFLNGQGRETGRYNITSISFQVTGAPPWSSSSVLDHRSLPPGFESRSGHIWRLFHLWLRLIISGGRSAHLAYYVHKSGRKTSIIIIILTWLNIKLHLLVKL